MGGGGAAVDGEKWVVSMEKVTFLKQCFKQMKLACEVSHPSPRAAGIYLEEKTLGKLGDFPGLEFRNGRPTILSSGIRIRKLFP